MIRLDLFAENKDRGFGEAAGYVPVRVRTALGERWALLTIAAIDVGIARADRHPEDLPGPIEWRLFLLRDWLERNAARLATVLAVLGALVLIVGLTSCAPRPVLPAKPVPVVASCSSLCTTPCIADNGDTGIRWDGSPVDANAWDILAEHVTLTLVDKLRVCETQRRACVRCLDSLRARGVIQ